MTSRDSKDAQRIARAILFMPLHDAPTMESESCSFDEISTKNVNVYTRIMLQMAHDAMKGDVKKAQFLVRQAGMEAAPETVVSVMMPTFLDDMTVNITPEKPGIGPAPIQIDSPSVTDFKRSVKKGDMEAK